MDKHRTARVAAIGAGSVALAGALWLALAEQGGDDDDARAVVAPTTVVRPAGAAVPADVRVAVESAPDAEGKPRTSLAAPTDPAGSAPVGPEGVAGASTGPVDTVSTSPAAGIAPDPSTSGTGVDLVLDQRDPVPVDADGAGDAAVAVPASYPISDAAKYFVPRDQRRPGNLGGPPPLDFPGGPNDPNGGGFAPPSAPGGG